MAGEIYGTIFALFGINIAVIRTNAQTVAGANFDKCLNPLRARPNDIVVTVDNEIEIDHVLRAALERRHNKAQLALENALLKAQFIAFVEAEEKNPYQL